MQELIFKYGVNPYQKPARLYREDGAELPLEVLNGRPGYINMLDALNSWQLVKELNQACALPAAASFKHVSPTSAALGLPLSAELAQASFVSDIEGLNDSPVACAYARARGTDRLSSFGDWAALSAECDETTARILQREVSDGIIAPGYTPKALEILRAKKKGNYNIIAIYPAYQPNATEKKQVYGLTFEQGRNDAAIDERLLTDIVTKRKELPQSAVRDLIIALVTLKYTQSNSVCFATQGQAIGVGAGQQSRIHCTRLAANKADLWHLRQHPKVLTLPFLPEIARAARDNAIDIYLSDEAEEILQDGAWQQLFNKRPEIFSREDKQQWLSQIRGAALASDAFFPFSDNIRRAKKSGVEYIAQPGGSVRDAEVIAACDELEMLMAFTGMRLFHH